MDDYDEHDWEYVDESIQEFSKSEKLNRLPYICQTCRWLDWYYSETYGAYNIPCTCLKEPYPISLIKSHAIGTPPLKVCRVIGDHACPFWARDLGTFKPHWLWMLVLRTQTFLWHLRVGFSAWWVTHKRVENYETYVERMKPEIENLDADNQELTEQIGMLKSSMLLALQWCQRGNVEKAAYELGESLDAL